MISSKQQYAIDADYADFENAGHVHYKPEFHSMDRNNWKLISLWVDDDYRKKKIATHLFKALHDDIKERRAHILPGKCVLRLFIWMSMN